MVGELILRCLHARTNAHELHLLSPTYAKHIALNEFYESITDPVDSIAEMMQDEKDIDFPTLRYTYIDDPVKLIKGLRDWVKENRYDAASPDETEVQNVIDEIVALCRTTLYKLRKLR